MGTPGHLVVKRYRLVRALGQGGMGIVWEGHDELLDRPVAIKEITPPPGLWPAQEAEFLLRVTHQALAATRVTDPSLVATYDVAEDDGRPWIVMELLPARSLDRVVAHDGPLTAVRAADIGRRVLDALAAAHTAGVVHGDVKPANVLIGYDGRVALSDLGATSGDGTPGFRAPEGAGTGPAADLWSLGATLYAAVIGTPPPAEPSLQQMPGPLRPVLWGLLSRDPAKRLKAAEAGRMLSDLSPATVGDKSAPKADRGRFRLLAAAVAAVVVAGSIGGWVLLGSPGDDSGHQAVGSAGGPSPVLTAVPTPTLSSTPMPTPTLTPARLPLKWYKPATGWQIAYPRDWHLTSRDGRQEWESPDGDAHLGVQVIDWGGGDPLIVATDAETKVSAAAKAYRKVRLERIKFTGARAAEWEGRWKAADPGVYPWAVEGVIYHEVRRVIYTGKTTTILTWVTTNPTWLTLKPTMMSIFAHYHAPEGDLLSTPR